MKIKEKVGSLFQLQVGDSDFPTYFNRLNSLGKITSRSTLDVLAIVLDDIYEKEQESRSK